MNRTSVALQILLLALISVSPASTAQAKDYLIEVVIFETLSGRDAIAGGLFYPKMERGLNLNTQAASEAGFEPVNQGLSLTDNAAAIAASGRYKLIRHLAWRQPGLDVDNAVPVRISLGNTTALYLPENLRPFEGFIPASFTATPERTRQINTSTVNGTIKVRLGRFLHLEALLAFTDPQTGQSFRLSQSRKMRSRELHYIDNPRFGLLTRILPINGSEGSTE